MDDLRKLAADVLGRAALEERFGHPRLSAVDIVLLHKTACADQELLKVAVSLGGRSSLRVHEELGGKYAVGRALASGVGGAAGAALGSKWKRHPTAGAAIGGGVGALVGGKTGLTPVLAPVFTVLDRFGKHGSA
jgi:hypothetical protein